MVEIYPDDPSHLAVSGLVDEQQRYSLEELRLLGGHNDGSHEVVVPVRRVIEDAGPTASATHVTAMSADGKYSASIPLTEVVAKGELHVREGPEAGSPIRLVVPGGMTLCWNVKDLGRLRVTEGPEPDSLPEVLAH